MTRQILWLFFSLLVSQHLYGQKLIAQHYSMANGLPSNEVFSVFKDKMGFIWLATDRGLCRFDGKTFKIYTVNDGLSENSTLEVKEDKQGKIWCRSYSGLFTVIDRDSVYSAAINKEIQQLKIGRELYQFEFDDKSNLYLSTRNNGLVYKSPFPYDKISPIQIPTGNITFFQLSSTTHITSYAWSLKFTKAHLNTVIALNNGTRIKALDKTNLKENFFLRYVYTPRFLIISTNEFIHTFSLQSEKMVLKLLPFKVSSMSLLSDSTVFVGGFKGELAIFNISRNTFKVIDKFPSSISSIYFAKNYCWVTTLRNGVYYIPNINYEILYKNSEPLISMLPVSADSLYLLNANSEIELINNGKLNKLLENKLQKTLMYWQRFDHSQREYIPLVGRFDYIIQRPTKKRIKLHHNSQAFRTEFIVPMDSIICKGYYTALDVFDKKGVRFKSSIPVNGRLTCMYGHKGVLYMGTQNGAFKLVDYKSLPLDSHSFFKNRIAAIDRIGNDSLVIATQANGIGLYNLKTRTLSIVNNNGLDRLTIQYVYVDDARKIWVATQQSIHVLLLNANMKHQLLDAIDLNMGDLSIKEVRTLNRQVYILAGNQVVKIDEKLIQFNLNSYPVILNELLINGKKRKFTQLAPFNLSPNENNLLVKFQLLSYTQNQIMEYRYRLNNEPWVYTTSNELQLASLPSNSYQLNIQGRLKNGSWNGATPFNFTIRKPFYKTGWFISVLILSSIILLYYFISMLFKQKYRKKITEFELKRELESARLMASKSQMNPHFIFNALNSIQNFIIKSEKIQAYEYLTDFSTLIRSYLEYSNKDYIKLDSELELINKYIKIEQLRIPFQFELELTETIKPSEDYIFSLLLQPFLENAIWHGLNHKAGDKKLSVSFKTNGNFTEINITDNGVGRAQSAIINANRVSKPASVATKNMQNRINSLRLLYKNDIKIEILDNFDSCSESLGTTVLIRFEKLNEKV